MRECGHSLAINAPPAAILDAFFDADALRTVTVSKSVTVARTPQEVYALWRDFANLPRFMETLTSVESRGGRLWRWQSRGPLGSTFAGFLYFQSPRNRISLEIIQSTAFFNAG